MCLKTSVSKRFLSIATVVFALQFGCGSDDNPTQSGNETARISGRVTDDAGYTLNKSNTAVEGAVVTLAEIQSNGSLRAVSSDTVETDANGDYLLQTELDDISGLVVVAVKGNETYKATLSAEINRGETQECQPHNEEATTESELREEHARRGMKDEVDHADDSAIVTAELAAEIKGDASALAELAAAVEAEAEARQEFLLDASVGATQSQINNVSTARADAQIALETALNAAAGSQTAIETAFEAFQQATLDAYTNAGIEISSYARSKQASGQVMTKNSTTLNAQAELALEKSLAVLQAYAVDSACQAEFTAMGAANAQVQAVATAGANLRSEIRAATNVGQVQAAFNSHHDAVISALQISASAHSTQVGVMDATINGVGGARATLITELAVAANTEAVIDAYLTFFSTIETLVETTLTTATEAEVSAISEVLVQVNMHD